VELENLNSFAALDSICVFPNDEFADAAFSNNFFISGQQDEK
jgi:hypothetical protein